MTENYKKVREVAEIYRISEGMKVPAKTCRIRLSASDGTVEYTKEESKGEAGYVAFVPKETVMPLYLYHALCSAMPAFLAKYKSGINLKFEVLKYLEINVPTKKEQQEIVDVLEAIDEAAEKERRLIAQAKEMKKSMLRKMFTE